MSRLPLPDAPSEIPCPAELVLLVEFLLDGPGKAHEVRSWTRKDPVLSQVLQYIHSGWPQMVDPELKVFQLRRCELFVEEGCILWGARVLVPFPGRKRVLAELHEGHPGMSKMKRSGTHGGQIWTER